MISEEVRIFMTWLEIVIRIACILFGVAVACTVTIPKLVKAIKARKSAKSAEDKANADAEIKSAILEFVELSEQKYAVLNTALKNIGETGAGPYKKDNVLSLTRDFCDEKGYEFNKQEVTAYIDKVVDLTKSVNK